MSQRILFVLSSHAELGDTGRVAGYYIPEAAEPHKVVTDAGYEVDFVSPKGGTAPSTGRDLSDPVQAEFLGNEAVAAALANTKRPQDVNPSDYVAVHYVGGHGTMWDMADNVELAAIAQAVYERGGVISAVCHGPAGLVNVKLGDGSYLVDGKGVAAFTDDEERAAGLTEVVPYLLEAKLKERGANHTKAENFQPHVVVDGRLVTGQNPKSAFPMAEALVKVLAGIEIEAPAAR